MTTKTDIWRYWRRELAEPGQERDCAAAASGYIAGYWRTAGAATKCDWPLAILPSQQHGNALRAIFGKGGGDIIIEGTSGWDDFVTGGAWLGCKAVTYEEHQSALQTGFWADGRPARPMDTLERRGFKKGDDVVEDEAERLQRTIDEQALALEQHKTIQSQDAADEVAAIVKLALALEGEAKRLFEAEKKPALQKAREIDERWRPVTTAARRVISTGRLYVQDWLASQKPNDPEPVPDAPRPSVGKVGEKLTVRKVKRAVIIDYNALLEAVKTHPDVRNAVEKVSQASARAGITLPGMEIVEDEKVI